MVVNWIEAIKVAGLGFGTVFIVLIILWLVTSGIGIISQKTQRKQENEPEK
jgi:Na+-transporting methylmalonyl-CoA/oxaloacetate decarboxylase gamma subunit